MLQRTRNIALLAIFIAAPLLADKFTVRDVTYSGVRAFLVEPAALRKAPAIVFVHWGLGDRHTFFDEAKSLAQLGVASLLIDASFDLEKNVIDVRRGVDFLSKRPHVDKDRIAFVGLSYGGHLGALLVPQEPRFKAFVLMGAFASNADAEHNPQLAPLDAERFVKQPHTAPIFFQFARKDEYIDYAQASRFVEAASPPRIAKWYEAGHEFDVNSRRDRFAWLSTILYFPLPDENYFAVGVPEVAAAKLGRYAELSKLGVVIDIPGTQQITVKRDVVYKGSLKIDVYYPFGMKPADRVPAVLLVSGQAGSPLMEHLRDVRFNTTMARAIAARSNRIVVVCDIRPTYTSMTDPAKENAALMDTAADLDDLLTFLRSHADGLQIDKDSLAIFTRSAGWSYGLRAALRGSPEFVKAIVAYSPRLSSDPLRGTGVSDDLLPQFSPIALLRESTHFPPFLLVTAGHDDFYVADEVNAFLAAAKEKSAGVTHIHVAEGEHGFEIMNDYDDSRDALRRTFIFLHDHLPIRSSRH